jgi:hypothetical protein
MTSSMYVHPPRPRVMQGLPVVLTQEEVLLLLMAAPGRRLRPRSAWLTARVRRFPT